MRRRQFLGVLGGMAAVWPFAVRAQQPRKVSRIGFLWSGSFAPFALNIAALRGGLQDLGYVEGQNIVIDYRFAEGQLDRLPALAAELAGLPVDIIVTVGDVSIRAARQVTRTIPIVVVRTSDLVAQGFAASLSLPGGNITGQVDMSPELSAKQLSLLKELIPSATQVAVLWNSANLGKKQDFSQIQVAAEVLSIQVRSFEVRSIGDIELAFVVLARERTGAALFLDDALTSNYRQRIVDLAAAIRTPSMHHTKEAVRLGALMSYGAAELALFRNSATFIDKILKGAKPADLPIERPTKFELVINLKTAKTLGVDVPLPLLYRADEVIE